MSKSLKEFDTLSPAHDARQGRGYGRTGKPTGAGTTWQKGKEFPYIEVLETTEEEEEEMEDMWDSPETASKFMSKLSTHFYGGSDPYGRTRARVDRGSFAHSSGRGLGENVAKGMSPFPNMYKNRGAAVGGMSPTVYKTAPGRKGGGHGSKKGWSASPPVRLSDETEPAYTLEDILDLDDDERALKRASDQHEELVSDFYETFLK